MTRSTLSRIAIVGLGGLFPGRAGAAQSGPEQLWADILAATDTARPVPSGRWLLDPDEAFDPQPGRPDRVYSRRGCFLADIPSDPALPAGLDPLFSLTLHVGRQAWASAVTAPLDRSRVGVILGNIALPTERSAALAWEILGRTLAERIDLDLFPSSVATGVPPVVLPSTGGTPVATEEGRSPQPLNRYVAGLPAGLLAQALGLGGGGVTLDAACASSLYAIQLAAAELQAGRLDAVLAGGVSRPDCLYTQMGFAQLRALSPTGRAAPFDAGGDGLVVGEGAGIFVLKRLDDALHQGDIILAVLAGGGLSNDLGGGLLAPSSEGQLRAMRAAYRAAGWRPSDVDLIECHATGTPVGDAVEFASLRTLWEGMGPGRCVLGSVKSTVGHLLTAAGAAGLTRVLFALRQGVLPPTANFVQPAPGITLAGSPFRVLTAPEPWHRRADGVPRRAAISGFGFGGINAHLLLEEWLPAKSVERGAWSVEREDRSALAAPRSTQRSAPRSTDESLAVVGLGAAFGPWQSLATFCARVYGNDARPPSLPTRWWGVEKAEWFRAAGLSAEQFRGFYVDAVRLGAARFRIPPRELVEMLPQQLLLLRVADEALSAAGHDAGPHERTGAFVGLGLDLNTTQFHLRWALPGAAREWARRLGLNPAPEDFAAWVRALCAATGPALNANRTMGALGSIAASRVARAFRLGSSCFTLCSEDSSGLRAFEVAVRALQRGDLDVALVGAVDLAGDVRSALATRASGGTGPVGEGAAAVVLKRLADAERADDTIYAVVRGCGVASGATAATVALDRASAEAGLESVAYGESPDTMRADLGDTGAAAGLAALVKACLALHTQTLPPRPGPDSAEAARHWLRDRQDGPRRATVSASSIDGTGVGVVLEEHAPTANAPRPTPFRPREALFVVKGDSVSSLLAGLDRLGLHADQTSGLAPEESARRWVVSSPATGALALALVARDAAELRFLVDHAHQALISHPEQTLPGPGLPAAVRDRVFFAPDGLGPSAQVAFVFPGSGNDFPGMGRDLALWRPDVLRRQDAENLRLRGQYLPRAFWRWGALQVSPRDRIFAQVTLATLVADLFATVGVRPQAVLGHSLGESAALFALRAWTDRDGMLARMERSSLFQTDLVGPCDAAHTFWDLPPGQPVDWSAGIVAGPAAALRAACSAEEGAYLLIINTPNEGVIGGRRSAVEAVVRRLGCPFLPLPDTATVHCPIARLVADPYRELHRLPTTPPSGVRFYSTAQARAYELDEDSAAEAILAQALDTIDFPAVVEAAYRDGVRIFVEIGPGGSCTRFVDDILGDRPHRARSACLPGADNVGSVLRVLALLIAEGVPVDLTALYAPAPELPALPPDSQAIEIQVGGAPFVLPPLPPDAPVTAEGSEEFTAEIAENAEEVREVFSAISAVNSSLPLSARDLAPQLTQTLATVTACQEAQATYLRLTAGLQQAFAAQVAFQTTLLEVFLLSDGESTPPPSPLPEAERGSKAEHNPVSASTADVLSPLRGGRGVPSHPLGAGLSAVPRALNRAQCLEFAVGSIGRVLGPIFAPVDAFPTRVRLPDEPLMLVDRILVIEGEPLSLTSGRVVTEHDVRPGAWYLDGGRIPTCLAVESGQADLFLSGFLGIDFRTRGLAVYRLLDAVVTFHRGLPGPGQVIRYDIHIDNFFRQGNTVLFRFRFVGSVDGEPLLTMTDGCAGFFGPAELAAGKGIVQTALDKRPQRGVVPDDEGELPPQEVASYDDEKIEALRRGDLPAAFGPAFAGLPTLGAGLRLPGGRLRLVHRIPHLDPAGGRFGVGLIRGEADIHPGDWFLTCHFVDDQVMPGTLMYECCLHTLRVFLLRLGWVSSDDAVACEPVPGAASRLRCRGQVTATTRTVTYEVTLKERGYRPEPYALVDALMYADGKPIVECLNMSLRLTGLTREAIRATWQTIHFTAENAEIAEKTPIRSELDFSATSAFSAVKCLYSPESIRAFAVGKPSEAFGEPYRVFDSDRVIARLPGPPYQFLDRVTHVEGEPFRMAAGAACVAEYDVPPGEWFFEAERQPRMPFAVLLEVALQPCGWLAAYVGSALTSPTDLSFRNLGGTATLLAPVTPASGTLSTSARLTRVSNSGGMIIQHFDFEVRDQRQVVYRGDTVFGFFSKAALAQQVGLRDAALCEPTAAERTRGRTFAFPRQSPFPDDQLRMVDRIDLLVADGGQHKRGLIHGGKKVVADEWFFQAHFYQDPVWPGSLGLEAFLQLLKVFAADCWPDAGPGFVPVGAPPHRWTYRGQVLPQDREVVVEAIVTARDDRARQLTADGLLLVDGRVIYKMSRFTLGVADNADVTPGAQQTGAGRAQQTP